MIDTITPNQHHLKRSDSYAVSRQGPVAQSGSPEGDVKYTVIDISGVLGYDFLHWS